MVCSPVDLEYAPSGGIFYWVCIVRAHAVRPYGFHDPHNGMHVIRLDHKFIIK